MKRASFLAATALTLAALAPFALSQDGGTAEAPAAAVVGQTAPDIQVQHWIGGDGRTSIRDFLGEVVFIELWGTH